MNNIKNDILPRSVGDAVATTCLLGLKPSATGDAIALLGDAIAPTRLLGLKPSALQKPSGDATNSIVDILNPQGDVPMGPPPHEHSSVQLDAACDDAIDQLIDRPALYHLYKCQTPDQQLRIDDSITKYKKELIRLLADRAQYVEADGQYQFPHDEFKRRVGMPTICGTKTRKSMVMSIVEVCPVYTLTTLGSNLTGKVSMIKLNFDLLRLLDTKQIREITERVYEQDINAEKIERDDATIDMDSLRAYIKGNENLSYSNSTTRQYNAEARLILLMAEAHNGLLPQVVNESPFGRRYYRGLNLQNTSRVVRYAALGKCYEYDLNAAVYAIKFNMCADIDPFTRFTYTGEYLEGGGKYKSQIRNRLARLAFNDSEHSAHVKQQNIDRIKTALTMIGFGATKSGKGYYDSSRHWKYGSLAAVFSYQDKTTKKPVFMQDSYDRFINDSWVSCFFQEQTAMTNMLFDYFTKTTNFITKENHPFLLAEKAPRLSKNRCISYLFQSQERIIMDQVHAYCVQQNIPVLLRVHDAIYTKTKLNMVHVYEQVFKEIQSPFCDWLGTKLFWLNDHAIEPYTYDSQLLEHKQFIKLEELKHGKGHRAVSVPRAPVAAIASDSRAYDGGVDWGTRSIDLYDNDTWNSLTTRAEKQEYCCAMNIAMPDSVAATTPDFIQQLLKQ